MKNISINNLKIKYGTIVLNSAIINAMDEGIETIRKKPTNETLKTINQFFEKIEKENLFFPVTQDFVKRVFDCEQDLAKLDQLEILTYFKKEQFEELYENEKEDNL